MIQEIGDKIFDNHFRAGAEISPGDRLFIFENGTGNICMVESGDGELIIPRAKDTDAGPEDCIYLFSIDDEAFYMLKSSCPVRLRQECSVKAGRSICASLR